MLTDLQSALFRALASDAPNDTLRREAESLGQEDRALVAAMDGEGFLLASLLVRKLRFERICRGDAAMEEWFEREPVRFTEVFRAYNREVLPTEYFPLQEALAFRKYCSEKNLSGP